MPIVDILSEIVRHDWAYHYAHVGGIVSILQSKCWACIHTRLGVVVSEQPIRTPWQASVIDIISV